MENKIKNEILKEINLHKEMLDDFESKNIGVILKISEAIINSLKKNGTIYLCGNGGSAADSQHIAGELIGRFRKNRNPIHAIAFSTDTSVLTCISNDFDFTQIFKRQVEALIESGDILWVFSTSGSSPNILEAVKVAKKKGAIVISFTGLGKRISMESDLNISINTNITSIIQEIHQVAYHIICAIVEKYL